MSLMLSLLTILLLSMSCVVYEPAPPTNVFKLGEAGHHTFRIPAIVTTKQGSLLAFSEGRVNGRSDTGDINLVMKRSEDGGHTWSDLQVIWDDSTNVSGNPCPVVLDNGDILLLLTWNHGKDHESHIKKGTSKYGRIPYIMKSTNDGKNWSKPRDISAMADKKEWMWYATGPGNGIQLKHGKSKGRIVIPCANSTVKKGYNSHVIYSDDNGETWKYSQDIGSGSNESTVVELTDGTLIFNTRQQSNKSGFRGQAISNDGGVTWSEYTNKTTLKDPTCQASFITYKDDILLFANPQGKGRADGVIQISSDGAKSWQKVIDLPKGGFAYSSMTVLPSGDVGILYETHAYKNIHFRVIPSEKVVFKKD
jgi:sialidase-1